MKRFIYVMVPILFSIFVGSMFMEVSGDSEAIPVIGDSNSVKIFQTGVYTNRDEAEKEASLKKGIVISENENYNVYAAILKNESNINRMMKYLDDKNIYYYIKDKSIDSAFIDTLSKYEDLMLTSTSSVAFLQLNKKILERYELIYEN